MNTINWGIIGCGDVTEIKSGPAFNKVSNSSLAAVMRRDGAKAQDYAQRHKVARWYDNAAELINDPGVNAIYIATPPSSHEHYTLAAINAGKPVYVEKPMALNYQSALKMNDAAREKNVKLSIAHYRREQPMFKKIKELISKHAIGKIKLVKLHFSRKPLTAMDLAAPKIAWRVDPNVAGGGLFHDLAPHQVDLLIYFFKDPVISTGLSSCNGDLYAADDIVTGLILFENNIIFNGFWDFQNQFDEDRDDFEIIGSAGRIQFSVFDNSEFILERDGKKEIVVFDKLEHVQQPMIEKVVEYFLGNSGNPCSAEDGARVMQVIDNFTGRMT